MANKGQWKRQTKQQGKEENQQDTQMYELQSEGMLKRDRHKNNQEQEDIKLGFVSKKLRSGTQDTALNISEVKETSRD